MSLLESLVAYNPVEKSFLEFHAANPHVYAALVELAWRAKRQGHDKVGIDMLHAVARWYSMIGQNVVGSGEFLLNNNHRPYYARLIMLQESELFGMFDVREIQVPSSLEALYVLRLREEPASLSTPGEL